MREDMTADIKKRAGINKINFRAQNLCELPLMLTIRKAQLPVKGIGEEEFRGNFLRSTLALQIQIEDLH
jgi:hypothetical protein